MPLPARGSIPALALFLAVVGLLGGGMMVLTHWHASPRIEANERQHLLNLLTTVAPAAAADPELASSATFLPDPDRFPGTGGVVVYRAYAGNLPLAAILDIHTPDGYSGPIRLLVGVDPQGAVTGVRVVAHRETPGLGDAIEAERSDWVRGFDGRSLAAPPATRWRLRREGGDFDQLTGATITARAVLGAVRRALEFHEAYRAEVLPARAAQPEDLRTDSPTEPKEPGDA
jgi:Na+-translocating ferredoxin:NAD+ oxidoreductase subunit G